MKKVLFMSAIAAAALASCTSDEYVGQVGQTLTESINFGTESMATTRATLVHGAAAEKLNNNFVVYGFKTNTAESSDQMVFDHYNVNYEEGTANTTESNTAGWEYVGFANHSGSVKDQTIKYWDYSQDKYVFSAVSGTGITAEKITSGSVYDKGWTVKIPAGGDLSTLYASDRKPVEKADYKKQVDLTFRALGTKIRFAMYETVPGYEVHVDKFYYQNSGWQNTTTNLAVDGTFKNVNSTAETPLKVTYYDNASGIENRPKVTFDDADVDSKAYGIFGANIQATPALGTTSVEATYDQSDKSYTMILPYESTTGMNLYVDYTLTSTDGSGEKIEVKHASAKVPVNYLQWKPNFAYTYLFKISDNTNGTTGDPTDPDNPTVDPTDPKGLYPITFDAVVIAEETDVQETITTVAEPSITTYQEGQVITTNNEYKAGDIYVTVMKGNPATIQTLTGSAVFEVHNTSDIEKIVTEEVVANWANNFCTLTGPVGLDLTVTEVPLNNGTKLSFTLGTVARFTAQAGKTYVFCYANAGGVTNYKVIRVAGSETTPSYSLTKSGSADITTTSGTETLTLTQDGKSVFGAIPCFEVTSTGGNKGLKIAAGAGAGEYTVSVDPAAIAAGKANDDYTVTFGAQSVAITVNIDYVLRNAADAADITAVNIIAGNTTGATVINKIDGAAADGDVTEVPDGIKVEKTATGTYQITADADMAYDAYDIKIAGQTLTVNVDSYAFLSDLVITKGLAAGTYTGTLTLQKNGGTATGTHTLTGAVDATATHSETNGVYTFTAVAGGSFDVTYENATAKVTVNAYTMDVAPVAPALTIKKSTGVANITVKCNGTTINAATASLVNTAKPDVLYADKDEYNAAKGTSLDDAAFTALSDADKVKTAAVYTVTTNGKLIKFSNASIAGDYEFDYKVGTTVVAHVVVTVTP